MRLHRRVAWLTVVAVVVGVVCGFASIINYFTAKGHLEYGSLFSDPPSPSVAAVLIKYWWGWVAIMLVWISVVFLARRLTRTAASTVDSGDSDRPSPLKLIVAGEALATVGTVTDFLIVGGLAGWL